MRVLLIDDNPDDRALVEMELGREFPDIVVTHVRDRAAVDAALEAGEFDLVVTDYKLMWTTGLDVLRAVRGRFPDVAIIMFTGTGSEEIVATAMKEGLDDYVLKSTKHLARIRIAARAAVDNAKRRSGLRKREQVLRASEESFRLLFDANPNPMWVFDQETLRYLAVNEAAIKLYGYSREEFVAMRLADVCPPEEVPALLARQKARTSGIRRSGPWRHRTKAGRLIEVETAAHDIAFNGRDAGLVVIHDVTERRRAEQALHDSRERLELALQAADLGLWDFNPRTGDVVYDERWARMLGYAVDELRPRIETWESLVHPEDVPRTWAAVKDHFAGRTDFVEIEFRMRAKSGEWRWILSRGRVMQRDPAGEPIRMTGTHLDITDRKRAESALNANRERLDLALEGAEIGFWEANGPAGEMIWDPSLCRLLGYAVEDLPPRIETWQQMLHPDDRMRALAAWGDYLAGRTATYESEYRLATKSGDWLWIWDHGRAVESDPAGRPLRAVGTALNITDRKRAELELRASGERLELAVEGAKVGLWEWSPQTGELLLHQSWCRLFGYSVDELSPRIETWEQMVDPDELPAVWKTYSEFLARRIESCDIEFRMRAKSGDWRWVLAHSRVAERDPAGQPLRVIGSSLDITERKRAELAIRESEARFRSMADTMPALVWVADEEDRCVFVNRPWLEYTGRTAEQVLGRGWIESVHPEDLQKHIDLEQAHVRLRTPYASDYRLRGKDGNYRWFFDRAVPRLAEDGTFLGYIGVLLDVEDRRHLEAQLRQAQKMEAVGQLAGGIAHDFNNLLLVILANLEIIQQDAEPRLRDAAGLAMSAAQRGAELTHRMLAFGRRQTLQATAVELSDVIGAVVHLLTRTLGENIEIETRLAPRLRPVIVDRGQLENALLNLAINARDAMPTGGRLSIEASDIDVTEGDEAAAFDVRPGSYANVAVRDTGTGMAPEVLARAVEPFYTTKGVGKGSGLGLSMIHGFVQQSGGGLRLESEPGRGTTVRLLLPFAAQAATVVKSTPSGEHNLQGSGTVLLVEDDDEVRRTVTAQLISLGYSVLTAPNGVDALQVLASNGNIDLLLTDLVMPGGLNGRALAREARRIRPGIKVVLSTGYSSDDAAIDGTDGTALLAKPYRRADLARKLREILGGMRSP